MQRIVVVVLAFAAMLAGAIALAGPAEAQQNCRKTPEGTVCTQQQPIVTGDRVSTELQQERGLVTVAGGCSGTLINDWWVLTAQHCISVGNAICGPQQPPGNIQVTAAWSTRTPTATRIVDYCADGLDMAMVELGAVNFGDVPIQLLFVDQVDTGTNMQKFGQGFPGYASLDARGRPVAAPAPDGYRTAFFTAGNSQRTGLTLNLNAAGQVGHGGDSGGPDYVVGQRGVLLGIAAVQSTCNWTSVVAGAPAVFNWRWVTAISSCTSAPIFSVRDRIIDLMWENRDYACSSGTAFCGAGELTAAGLLLLK